MGGYGYLVQVSPKRPSNAAVRAAGIEIWEWFRGELEKLPKTRLRPALLDYVDMEDPTIRHEDSGIAIYGGDAGGVAYLTCLAAFHTLTRLVDRNPSALEAILEPHGFRRLPTQQLDPTIRQEKFLWLDGAIAMVSEASGIVERDSNGYDDGESWSLDDMPAAVASRVNAFRKRERCECPICATRRSATRRR